jgi:hypothetical protein
MLEELMRNQKGIPNPLSGTTSVNAIVVESPTPTDLRQASKRMSVYKRSGLGLAQARSSAA